MGCLDMIQGYLREVSLVAVERLLAYQALKGIYFDLAFLGANAISIDHSLTIPSLEEAETAAEIVGHSQRTIVVADHTKFGIVAHGKLVDITDIDVIIAVGAMAVIEFVYPRNQYLWPLIVLILFRKSFTQGIAMQSQK